MKGSIDEVIDEIGDISGWTVLDMGSGPCTMVACLANRIGNGRIFAVDLYMGLMDTVRKILSEDQMLKTIILKADLRRLDFLKDNLADLITAHDTLSVIDEYTPNGTPYVLNEARRILKPDGWFLAVEHYPLESINPVDKAQKAELDWWKIHIKIAQLTGDKTGVEYTPKKLLRALKKAGFITSHWKRVQNSKTEPGIKFGPKILNKVEKIGDKSLRKTIFSEMKSIEKQALTYGMKELPHFAVYAKNPKDKALKKLEKLPLEQLYRTVCRRDLLF